MVMITRAIEIRVCFKNKLKNTSITVATDDISEARRIAKIWGEKDEGEPVTRTIFQQEVSFPDRQFQMVDGVRIWPPLF